MYRLHVECRLGCQSSRVSSCKQAARAQRCHTVAIGLRLILEETLISRSSLAPQKNLCNPQVLTLSIAVTGTWVRTPSCVTAHLDSPAEDVRFRYRTLVIQQVSEWFECLVLWAGRERRTCKELKYINLLKTKRRLLYLKTQFVPRSKHFPLRL